jgi:hypothetical protein
MAARDYIFAPYTKQCPLKRPHELESLWLDVSMADCDQAKDPLLRR